MFGRSFAQSSSHLIFWIFSITLTSKHLSNNDVNIKQFNTVKSSKFNGFVFALFCVLGLSQNLTAEKFELCRIVVF